VNPPYNGPIPLAEIAIFIALVVLAAWLIWRARR
jgi:hypothetical protein